MSRSDNKEMVELVVYQHRTTEKAWLVSQTKKEIDAKWLPKSQCKVLEEKIGKHPIELRLEVPGWLVEEKGFV